MRVLSFQVFGLMGRSRNIELNFHSDLNIITGFNGSGKTTILKLLWFLLSGNVHIALKEIPFRRCVLETDEYTLSLVRVSEHTCEAEIETSEKKLAFQDEFDSDHEVLSDARDEVKDFTSKIGSSLFFPTFRRLEGGFGIDDQTSAARSSQFPWASTTEIGTLQKAVSAVSRRLSNGQHTFVTSIATTDISELIQGKYTDLSEQANAMQREINESVVQDIQNYKSRSDKSTQDERDGVAAALLDEVGRRIEKVNERRDIIMQPLSAIQRLVIRIFRHKGIKMSGRVSFGDTADAIASDKLSAGEKQMLSFICYNALYSNSIIFIDEPELSLHVDWQRTLFPTLVGQNKDNQFIIATHSPFIYSKYPEKELLLASMRGDEDGTES
ncbi:AAA family ATPase [Sphingomonas glaciei]|uniref:ATP-binding protein n=1 Tax=Sphingomonas glaciei TaxID=2938948 RepID=A0ABY5MUT5_9SPHN|nr:ATP-binding protein [Sphingomonas glaciei]UUR08248.1 ATP-binding protein [Sphingomonas glaciei]